jgi:glyoxylase-like metal-dependent hydrolase (beta-lactamase superfamily II)
MKSRRIASALIGLMCAVGASVASAADAKVYWTTSGYFGPFNIQGLIPSFPTARDITIPVSMWIIDHPKGLMVFDTGNNVAVSDGGCQSHWAKGICEFVKPSQKREDVIDMQLKKLGYSVDKVKVVVHSHTHHDHIGNIEMFPNAIHMMQKKELYQGWWPEKFQGREQLNGVFVQADIDGTRGFNFVELEGDYDVFGDGSVQLLSTPGHTLGHQSMKVKMGAKTIVITQDAVWMKENLEGYAAGLNYSVQDYFKSVNRLKAIRDLEGAELLMAHDGDQYAAKGGRWVK